MTIKIAVIGSGPSAFYTVQNLVKSDLISVSEGQPKVEFYLRNQNNEIVID